MDNQQETVYIAGLMDGEGHFGIHKLNLSSGTQYRSSITFTNTDRALIKVFVDFVKAHNLAHHIRTDARDKGRKVCFTVQLTSIDAKLQFIKLVEPCLRGEKKLQAQIMYKFLANRQAANAEKTPRNELGQFIKGFRAKFDESDIKFYRQYRDTRAPQRLHASLLVIG